MGSDNAGDGIHRAYSGGANMITVAELLKSKELGKKPKRPKKKKPPKTYLNAEERKEVIIAAAFVAEWQEMIQKWQELGRPTNQIKWAKMALTFIFKTMDEIMLNLPDSEKLRVIREASKSKIFIEGRV